MEQDFIRARAHLVDGEWGSGPVRVSVPIVGDGDRKHEKMLAAQTLGRALIEYSEDMEDARHEDLRPAE